jgi:hypothetical protein
VDKCEAYRRYVSNCNSARELHWSVERLCSSVVFLMLKDGCLGNVIVSERRS